MDARNPDAYKNGLAFVLKKKPNAHAENETEKCCENKKVPAFEFHFFSCWQKR